MALLAHGGRHGPITVSTLKEAEYFARRGFSDLTYAVAIAPNKFARAAVLVDAGVDLKVLVSDGRTAQHLAEFAEGRTQPLKAMLEIDSGEHRTGFLPSDSELIVAGRLLDGTDELELVGLLTHGGHSYDGRTTEDFVRVAEEERLSLIDAARRLEESGVSKLRLSSGSTPTATFGADFTGLDELRPGVYLAGDLFQAQLGTVVMEDIAISVLACVIACDSARHVLMIDAGALALSKDRSTAASPIDYGYGLVVREDGSRFAEDPIVSGVHQEHGEVTVAGDFPFADYPVGSLVRVLPNHACMTAAGYDRYAVTEGSDTAIVDEWEKVCGW